MEEIEIVLDNLIGNALKFSALREVPELRVTATTELRRTVVHVSDNGVGIAQRTPRESFSRSYGAIPASTGPELDWRFVAALWSAMEDAFGQRAIPVLAPQFLSTFSESDESVQRNWSQVQHEI